jgi:predicted phosphoribosyltransferase
MVFKDRIDAGQKLAKKVKKFKKPYVLAIPRGGVVIGAEISKKLKCPLDIIVARKMGAPGNSELAIGAVTADGDLFLDDQLVERIGVRHEYILEEQESQMKEAERREDVYRSGREEINLKGKVAILVDDGLATGATMEASVRSVRRCNAKKVVVAVPVAPQETVNRFKEIVDEVVALSTPESFWAIGQFYEDFPQVSDEEVIEILKDSSY